MMLNLLLIKFITILKQNPWRNLFKNPGHVRLNIIFTNQDDILNGLFTAVHSKIVREFNFGKIEGTKSQHQNLV